MRLISLELQIVQLRGWRFVQLVLFWLQLSEFSGFERVIEPLRQAADGFFFR